MPRILATAMLAGLFFLAGQAQSQSVPPEGNGFSIAAKKKSKKIKKKKPKKVSTGIPAYDKILELNRVMLDLIKKNQNDCEKVVSALKTFTDKNHAKYQKLAKARDAAIANMSPEQRQALTKRVEEKMWQITKGHWDTMEAVDKGCPYHKAEVRIYLSMFK